LQTFERIFFDISCLIDLINPAGKINKTEICGRKSCLIDLYCLMGRKKQGLPQNEVYPKSWT
jgi:hypothetical protein